MNWYIWTSMDMVPVEYGIFYQRFHFKFFLFQFITVLTFRLDYVMWPIVDILPWICIWSKLRIYIWCLQIQSSVIIEYLVLCDNHYLWCGCYCPINILVYITGKNGMLPQILGWRHPWWSLNISHVKYLRVFYTLKKLNTLIPLPLKKYIGLKDIIEKFFP